MNFADILNELEIFAFLYLAVGVLFAIPFYRHGIRQMDQAAQTGSLGFRIFIFPGVVIFWPLLARPRQGLSDEGAEFSSLARLKSQGRTAMVVAVLALIVVFTAVASRSNRLDPAPPKQLQGD